MMNGGCSISDSMGGVFHNFYNAKGEDNREQIGLAFSKDLVHWKRHTENPVIPNNPQGYDALLAANPKVYRDGDHWTMFYCAVGDKERGIGLLTSKTSAVSKNNGCLF